ncbi:hypothetical protein CMK11_18675 [Candidatus Poribacteria bacterium]|nr:hypothetical protein [Candidatus Poribacteria bacterium]
MWRYSAVAVVVACVAVAGFTGCRAREDGSAEDGASAGGAATTEAPQNPQHDPQPVTQRETADSPDGGPSQAQLAGGPPGELSWAELDERMARPIEESIYDPTLTREDKVHLLHRHYGKPGNHVAEPDVLMDAVMTEGMTHLEAADYWAHDGGSREWALYHAEAALRSDPRSIEALTLWALWLPRGRRNEREAAFLAVLEQDPTHFQALANLAGATGKERPVESMEYATRMIDTRPDSGAGYASMAWAYEWLGDVDMAISYYEAGLKVSPKHGGILADLDRISRGIHVDPLQAAEEANAAPDSPAPSSPPVTTGPPAEDASPASVPDAPGPPPPADSGPAPSTPAPVERYQNALDDYRSMADEFESITGQTYRGVEDFDSYSKESSNWMAWRYMELAQQYLDAGHPEEAASVFEKAAQQFPDDPLIQERMKQRR